MNKLDEQRQRPGPHSGHSIVHGPLHFPSLIIESVIVFPLTSFRLLMKDTILSQILTKLDSSHAMKGRPKEEEAGGLGGPAAPDKKYDGEEPVTFSSTDCLDFGRF